MHDWRYDPADDLDLSPAERLRHFPREPDMLSYGLRSAVNVVVRSWLATYHGLRIVGRHRLPRRESFVLVSNHTSHLDALCLMAAVPFARLHRTFPAAAADYFFVNLPRTAASVLAVNALPFDRRAGSRHSLGLCRKVLASSGNVLILFPEGTRSPTGRPGTFKPGVGLLLAGSNFAAVPCYLEGAHAAMPKGAWFPRPGRITLHVGTPRRYADLPADKASALCVCEDLRAAVAELASHAADRNGARPAAGAARNGRPQYNG